MTLCELHASASFALCTTSPSSGETSRSRRRRGRRSEGGEEGVPPHEEPEERQRAAMAGVRQGRTVRDALNAVRFTQLVLCSEGAATNTHPPHPRRKCSCCSPSKLTWALKPPHHPFPAPVIPPPFHQETSDPINVLGLVMVARLV